MSKDKRYVKDILAYSEVLRLVDFIHKDDLELCMHCIGQVRSVIKDIEGKVKEITEFEKLLDHGVYGNDDANLQDTIPFNLYNKIGSLVNYPSPTSRANLKIEIEKSLNRYKENLVFLYRVIRKLSGV